MARDFQPKHLKFFFSYVMAAFWDLGDILSGKHFAAPILHAKRIRVGLSKRGYDFARDKMSGWLQDLGLELHDEQSGRQMRHGGVLCDGGELYTGGLGPV